MRHCADGQTRRRTDLIMAELLAPAGNIEALDAAIGEGADAVYLGLKNFNARLRSTNFAWNQFQAAVNAVHRAHKKIYVTVNTVCEERELNQLYELLSYLNAIHPDALIVQDFATIRMAQEFFPELELHASTQMNVASAAGVNALAREGVKRVVLSRELGMEEIESIRHETNSELEIFVHGALCVSESGLCMFSSFLGGKSANRGMCTQACRRLYTANSESGERQGYYFSPCDLQLIDKIPALMELGVDSFKIEGRMKSADYVGNVVAAYRYVMDHWQEDKKGIVSAGKRMLASDFARSKTTYWYGFKSEADGVEKAGDAILNPDQAGGTGIYLGEIVSTKRVIVYEDDTQTAKSADYFSEGFDAQDDTADNSNDDVADTERDYAAASSAARQKVTVAKLRGGNYDPDPGDSIRLHKRDDTGRESHKVKYVQVARDGSRLIDIPPGFGQGDTVYLLQTKNMSRRYRHVLPDNLAPYKMQPRRLQIPVLDLTPVDQKQNELKYFPEGVYVQVSTIRDLFTAQGANPVRVILELNSETEYDLLNHKTVLPFSKKQIYISLNPFCAAASEKHLRETLETLVADGYTQYIVNNLAHISMLRAKKAVMIAGPYLYTFNRWAVSFLENQEIGAFVMPYENSRRNLEATFEPNVRSRVLVPIFAYPALFRMRFKMPESYDFTYFQDKEETVFKLNATNDGSFVMPESPFSIVDKIDLLRKNGFTRYLIDFSQTKVSKNELKKIMTALSKEQPLPGTYRFNWKEGFYVEPKGIKGEAANSAAQSKSKAKRKRK